MAGMAANISAFNTVFSYDLWERYIRKDRTDDYYLRIGRVATVRRDGHRDLHGAAGQLVLEHHGLPPDPVRVLQRPPVRDVHPRYVLEADDGYGGLDRAGLRARWQPCSSPSSAEDAFGSLSLGVIPLGGQGAAFVAASAAFIVDLVLSVGHLAVHQARHRRRTSSVWCTRRHRRKSVRTRSSTPTPGTGARCRSRGSRSSWSPSSTSSSEQEQPWHSKRRRRPGSSTSATSSGPCSPSTA